MIVHHVPTPDVKAIRKRTGMSQQLFCDTFGFNVATLRHWERGDSNPSGAANSLLRIIGKIPDEARKALEESQAETIANIVTEHPFAAAGTPSKPRRPASKTPHSKPGTMNAER